MRRHAIILRLGPSDRATVQVASDIDVRTDLPFFNRKLPAAKRVPHERITKELRRLGLAPSEIAMDLLVLSVSVFAADLRVSRAKDSQDGWTREIDLHVPVSDVRKWEGLRGLLVDLLRFLTGDLWRFYFRPRPRGTKTLASRPGKAHPPYKTDAVCLFSGGLDSFIGAIDLLESDTRPILVGHHKSADVAAAQSRSIDYLKKSYKKAAPEFADIHLPVPKSLFQDVEEKTERGRSFLFFSLAAVFAAALGKKSQLIVPENGLISLNVPLTPLRIGALSTKTTHPYFMNTYQRLIDTLGLNVLLVNPYQFKTKGEMVRGCRNRSVVRNGITKTMSCAHATARRWMGESPKHCGTCVPCLIRQAALRVVYKRDPTKYSTSILGRSLDVTTSAGEEVRAFKTGLARLRRYRGMEKLLVHESGPMPTDPDLSERFGSVYRRGMQEVGALLKKVSTS